MSPSFFRVLLNGILHSFEEKEKTLLRNASANSLFHAGTPMFTRDHYTADDDYHSK